MADVENKKYLDEAGLQRLADNRFLAPHPGENGETELTLGAYKVEVDEYGHVTRGVAMTPADIGAAPADSIGKGTITFKANGTYLGNFSVNQNWDEEINISLSDLNLTGAMHFMGVSELNPAYNTVAIHDQTVYPVESQYLPGCFTRSESGTTWQTRYNPETHPESYSTAVFTFKPLTPNANTVIEVNTRVASSFATNTKEYFGLFNEATKTDVIDFNVSPYVVGVDTQIQEPALYTISNIQKPFDTVAVGYKAGTPISIVIKNVSISGGVSGDIVLYDGKEYIYDGTNWTELGNEGDHALKTVKVEGDGTYITGGGDISQNRTLSHKTYTSAEPKIIAVGRDSGGHVVLGDELSVQSGGGSTHSHLVTTNVPADTFVTNIDTTTSKIGIEYDQADVVTNIDGAFNKLVTTSINGVSGSTTASKATAGTAINVATIGDEINYGTADVGNTVTVATRATAATQVASGTITTKKTADSTACAMYTAEVNESDEVLILSPVTVTLGTKNIYEAAGTAEVTSAVAADASRKVYAARANGSITPYTFEDITVPVAANAVTVATGAATTGGTGATIMTGLGTITTTKVLSDAGLATGLSDGFAVLTSASGTKAAKTISGTADARTCPAHTHTLATK